MNTHKFSYINAQTGTPETITVRTRGFFQACDLAGKSLKEKGISWVPETPKYQQKI